MQNKLAKIEGTNFVYEFLYNSRNERIAIGKAVNGADISWRYDACNGPVCIAEFDESADVSTYFVRGSGIAQGIGDVIAEVNYDGTSEEIHYYLYNHRGDVVCVVNPGSTPNTTYRYDAYGRCYENLGSFTSRYTFSTKEYLPDANLYLYQYRVYDPQAGRWTQRDPIDYADSINLYQFCGNNPINTWDPDGQKIIIRGTPKYIEKMQYLLKKLLKVPAIKLKIKALMKSERNHYIMNQDANHKIAQANGRNAQEREKMSKGIPAESIIKIDPDDVRTAKGNKYDPAEGLAHEIVHAYDIDKGLLKDYEENTNIRDIAEDRAEQAQKDYKEHFNK